MGFYEYNSMTFGLTNAPVSFQRRCMGEMNKKNCLTFLDDILVFSETFEAVFSQLQQHGLKLKASKCEFFKDGARYLGHIMSVRGVEADPDK